MSNEDADCATGVPQCDCYECIGPIYGHDEHGRFIKNNLKHHTLGEPCENCGREKSEYRDLGTKGYYVCYWCDGDGYDE